MQQACYFGGAWYMDTKPSVKIRSRTSKNGSLMNIKIIYSPAYDIRFYGAEFLHPFDSRKYSKAWELLRARFGDGLTGLTMAPEAPISNSDLLKVHTDVYVELLKDKKIIATALEVPFLGFLPRFMLERSIVQPMRWGTAGTVIASEQSLENGIAVNMSGGYHHASQQRGEGFCLFSDVGVAVSILREKKLLELSDKIAIIDLDAHQGNGFERVFMNDASVYIYDMYNKDIYPQDQVAKQKITVDVPLPIGAGDDIYMGLLKERLPSFLDQLTDAKLVFYNAGTDILAGDGLGGLNVSKQCVIDRDVYVFNQLIHRKLPFVMLLSGGYTKQSYQIIAESLMRLLVLASQSGK